MVQAVFEVKSQSYSSDDVEAFVPLEQTPEGKQRLEAIEEIEKTLKDLGITDSDGEDFDFDNMSFNNIPHADEDAKAAFEAQIKQACSLAGNIKKDYANVTPDDVAALKGAIDKLKDSKYKTYLIGQASTGVGAAEGVHAKATFALNEKERLSEMKTQFSQDKSSREEQFEKQKQKAAQIHAELADELRKDAEKAQQDADKVKNLPIKALEKFYAKQNPDVATNPDLQAMVVDLHKAGAYYDVDEKSVVYKNEASGRISYDNGYEVNTYIEDEGKEFDENDARNIHVIPAILRGHSTIVVDTHNMKALALIEKVAKEFDMKIIHAPTDQTKLKNDTNAPIKDTAQKNDAEQNVEVIKPVTANIQTPSSENTPEEGSIEVELSVEPKNISIKKQQDDLCENLKEIGIACEKPLENEKKQKTHSSFKQNFLGVFGLSDKQKAHKAFIKKVKDKQTEIHKIQNYYRKRVNASEARGQILNTLVENSSTPKNIALVENTDKKPEVEADALNKAVKKHNIESAYDVITSHMDAKYKALRPMDEGVSEIAQAYGLNLNDKQLMAIFGARTEEITIDGSVPIFSTEGAYTKEDTFAVFAKQQADRLIEQKQRHLALSGNSKDKPIVPTSELPFGEAHKVIDERYKIIAGRVGQISGGVTGLSKKEFSKDNQHIKDLYEMHDFLVKYNEHATSGYQQPKTKQKNKAVANFKK